MCVCAWAWVSLSLSLSLPIYIIMYNYTYIYIYMYIYFCFHIYFSLSPFPEVWPAKGEPSPMTRSSSAASVCRFTYLCTYSFRSRWFVLRVFIDLCCFTCGISIYHHLLIVASRIFVPNMEISWWEKWIGRDLLGPSGATKKLAVGAGYGASEVKLRR